jgi:hypothetical protein
VHVHVSPLLHGPIKSAVQATSWTSDGNYPVVIVQVMDEVLAARERHAGIGIADVEHEPERQPARDQPRGSFRVPVMRRT